MGKFFNSFKLIFLEYGKGFWRNRCVLNFFFYVMI